MTRHHSFCANSVRALFFIIIAITSVNIAQGQRDTTLSQDTLETSRGTGESKSSDKGRSIKRFPKNSLKMNITSLGLRNYHFTYERMLARKISASVGYRTMPNSRLGDLRLVKSGLQAMGEEAEDLISDLNNVTASNKAATLEFRFYQGRKPGAKGLYTGLFGRYGNFKTGYHYEYQDGTGKDYVIPIQANAKSFSGGLQFGAQFTIAQYITVDLQLFGVHFGKLKGDAIGVADLSTLSAEEQESLKEELEGMIPNTGEKKVITLDAQVNKNGVRAKTDSPFIGLRSGISVGISL